MEIKKYIDLGITWAIEAFPGFLLAIAVLVVGIWFIKKMSEVFTGMLSKSGFAPEITSFLVALVSIGLRVSLLISVAGMVGVDTAAFVGVLAAAGLAIGLALQGSLGNFAAGIIIVTFKPYKIDDWVEVKDKFGKVQDIQIFNTVVITPGNKTLVIPNGEVINGIITNFSKRGNIRIELKVLMPYNEDFPKVKSLIFNELMSMDKVLKNPTPEIGIEEFGDTNIVLSVRPYVLPDDYWSVYYDVMSKIKTVYHDNGIGIAFQEGIEVGPVGK